MKRPAPGMLEDRIAAEIPHLRRYARALTRNRERADDLVQDTLERALRKRHLWRPTGRLRSWLFRMLYRLYLNQHPRQRRERDNVVSLEVAGHQLGRPAACDVELHYRDVIEAMNELPQKQRDVLLLMALEQPSYTDGARMLGVAVGTFRSRLSRGRDELRKRMAVRNDATRIHNANYG